MKYRWIILGLMTLCLISGNSWSAKYAGDAFSLGVGGRGLALGGAVVAGPFDGTAPYWNPAGMNQLEGRIITAMHAETFGSLLNHDFVSYVFTKLCKTEAISFKYPTELCQGEIISFCYFLDCTIQCLIFNPDAAALGFL